MVESPKRRPSEAEGSSAPAAPRAGADERRSSPSRRHTLSASSPTPRPATLCPEVSERFGARLRAGGGFLDLGTMKLALPAMAMLALTAATSCRRAKPPAKESYPREVRESAAAVVAPAPAPTALPFAGQDGKDADGYPTRTIDRVGFRSLLAHKMFAELTRYVEELELAFEADSRKETWVSDAGDAFYSGEPEIVAALDAWVQATPSSFAPYLARGAHWTATAYVRRGAKWAKDTPGDDFAAMGQAGTLAAPDLERALALRPKLVAARRLQIVLSSAISDTELARSAIRAAVASCPSCYQVRAAYLHSLTPRWHGTYERMDLFAKESAAADASNPRLRLLAGYADLDRADAAKREKRFPDAIDAVDRARALGDYWEFSVLRAEINMVRGDRRQALVDAERAVTLRPGHPSTLVCRAWARYEVRNVEDAGHDLLTVLHMCPTNSYARELVPLLVGRLVSTAREAATAGRRDEALRLFDLATEIAPDYPGLQRERIQARSGASTGGDDVAVAEATVKANPDDLLAHQQLDDALARQHRYDRVVEIWTTYLGRHPDAGRAYLERGGAYFHLGKLREAQADAAKSCELGLNEGCLRAKQIGGRLR